MPGPDSRLLVAALVLVSAVLLVAAVRLRLLRAKIACGVLSIMMAMTGGIATVNHYYGYYTTWGELWADFHGTPGSPRAWTTVVQVRRIVDVLLAKHLVGPMVLVMPTINGSGRDVQDCVDGPAVQDDTYLTKDVRADVLARYRVSADPYEWGTAGYSSGGYCAANLALRHRHSFGAAAIIEGYFRAADGPAGHVLDYSERLEAANSPLYLAEGLRPGSGPIPALWVAAGTRDRTDYRTATVFATALDRIQQVPFVRLNAGDSPAAWSAALPAALTWIWQQLAPPDLRTLFPVRTSLAAPSGAGPTGKPVGTRPAIGGRFHPEVSCSRHRGQPRMTACLALCPPPPPRPVLNPVPARRKPHVKGKASARGTGAATTSRRLTRRRARAGPGRASAWSGAGGCWPGCAWGGRCCP